ncbi:right-handed parallel beta-helix repeat-containing protein [Micromonospora craniellae]|uniref:Uncharacterized protein n=1 Tax=Micromonospora craniellae TaxID=2294034 RepID=A0A372FZU5_9ACTN|nr:right-handed parallel beta-helix repeat-containing protein [Micromonospora craniellae]QOC91457.1 right-handed parallel beta-helix repeat-containing protein [Micromonospora craniellae]RFS46218.1 hypothetical protein D0Q02_12205 [Micromonospora craniellae]
MSTYRGSPGSRRPGRRSRWLLAGGLIAGTLAVGATGVTAVASASEDQPAVPGPGRPAAMFTAVPGTSDATPGPDKDRQRPEWRHDGGDADGARGGRRDDAAAGRDDDASADRLPARNGRPPQGEAVRVPCDSAGLIAALVRANAEGGATLRLAEDCTYTLTHAFAQVDEYDGGIRDAREAADAAENPGDAEAPARNPDDDKAGLPAIYHGITIEGSGSSIVRGVDDEDFRFFTVRDGGELTLRDVTLRNGRSKAEGGSIYVVHGATAVVEGVTVVDSTSLSAEGGGGGIFNDGNLQISDSRLIGNRAAGVQGKGGGLLNGGVMVVNRTEFRHNSAVSYGGGLANFRAAGDVYSSTFTQNHAGQGGGLASFSARTKVFDSAVVGNSAETGGGLANSDAVLVLRQMTIRDNLARVAGGGISTVQGLLPLDDSVVRDNTTRGNGGGIYAEKSNLLVRGSDVEDNAAVGPASRGAGLFVTAGTGSLYRSQVTGNRATGDVGGVQVERAQLKIDDETVVIENNPTNCDGSRPPVAHCFR